MKQMKLTGIFPASLGLSRRTLAFAVLCASCMAIVPRAYGQGCVLARSNGEQGGPETEGGYLAPGDFEFGIDYRHQFSYVHFVGPVEQNYRIQEGTQVENKINLENFAVTYQISPRFSISADIPLLTASRHTNDSPIVYTSAGIGDTSLLLQGWIWKPKGEGGSKGNILLGIGVLAPTGQDNVQNTILSNGKVVTVPVDYSVQPGQGGWGIPFQWVAFRNWRSSQFYFNGSYVAMTKDLGALNTRAPNPVTLVQYNAVSDEYLYEAGIAHPFSKIRGLAVLFGPRMEGVPARNLFPVGDNLGFRRPGFAISAEPGLQYVRNGQMFSITIARAIYRDRTVSVPDELTGGHGDAAFANWVWLASYTFRVGHGAHNAAANSHTQPHPASGTAVSGS